VLIGVVIVDDQPLFRDGLATLLSTDPELAVVGTAGDGAEAVRVCQAVHPSVVLMDLRMPVMDGATAIRKLQVAEPRARVLVLTTFGDDASVFDALRAGAVGYLLKDASRDELLAAIRAAHRGESMLSPAVATKVIAELARLADIAPPRTVLDLSTREIDVLRLIGRGASNKEIASGLALSEGTVKNHLTKIFDKLGVADRLGAAIVAREAGIV
jgi:DNA-binding NarL/FixJ family response regulator